MNISIIVPIEVTEEEEVVVVLEELLRRQELKRTKLREEYDARKVISDAAYTEWDASDDVCIALKDAINNLR